MLDPLLIASRGKMSESSTVATPYERFRALKLHNDTALYMISSKLVKMYNNDQATQMSLGAPIKMKLDEKMRMTICQS
jgi:hypothetical protein